MMGLQIEPRHAPPHPPTQLTRVAYLIVTVHNYSYRHAKALIMASKAEGFGLPLAEALQHGLTVLASDIPIHREVGQGACQYFPIQNPDGLTAAIRDLENKAPRPAEPFTAPPLLPDWQESAREFLAICKRYQSELNRP